MKGSGRGGSEKEIVRTKVASWGHVGTMKYDNAAQTHVSSPEVIDEP